MSTANLGAVIDLFCKEVQRTYPLWNAVVTAGR
jgi:hypothetical protein